MVFCVYHTATAEEMSARCYPGSPVREIYESTRGRICQENIVAGARSATHLPPRCAEGMSSFPGRGTTGVAFSTCSSS